MGILLVSVVLSIVGLVRTASGRRRGRGFAVAGLLLSVAWAAVIAITVPGLISRMTASTPSALPVAAEAPPSSPAPTPAPSSSPSSSPSPGPSPTRARVPPPKPVPARKEYVDALRTGDCLVIAKLGDSVLKVPVVPCRQAHDAEVVGVTQLAGRWHSRAAANALGDATCARLFERYVGVAENVSDHGDGWFGPTADSWKQGDRLLVCYAGDGGSTMTGSLKGTRS